MKGFKEFQLLKGGRVSIRYKDIGHVATDNETGFAVVTSRMGSVYRTKDSYDDVMKWLQDCEPGQNVH